MLVIFAQCSSFFFLSAQEISEGFSLIGVNFSLNNGLRRLEIMKF